MIKRGLTLVNAQHITASVFINDDESGLYHDYEVWLEELAPRSPIDQAGPEAGCTTAPARTPVHPGQGRRRAPEAADHGPRGCGRGDQRPAGLWHVGADLVSADWLTLEFDGRRRKRVLVKIIGK